MRMKLLAVVLFFLSFNVVAWTSVAGGARDATDGWVIGTAAAPGGYEIFRWDGNGWTKIPGGAVRIGGTYNSPWVVNDTGMVFRWNGLAWAPRPGVVASDVGDGFVVSTTPTAGGFEMFRWDSTGWVKLPGGGVRVGGTYKFPWVVNDLNQIFRWTAESTWKVLPGAGVDIADGWVLGTNTVPGGKQIFRWNGTGWTLMSGGGTNIGSAGGTPWLVNDANQIYRW